MAKKKKGGLGRGLNSLLGESLVESGLAPAYPASAPQVEEEEHIEISEPEPVEPKAPANKEVTLDIPEVKYEPEEVFIPSPEQPKEPVQPPVLSQKDIFEPELSSNEPKPRPYIEEDDHVEIKGVVSRERPKPEENEALLSDIYPNPDQPRTSFKEEEIDELAASIEKEGLLQPILVRKVGQRYQIIAGERRWQACKQLGLEKVPIRVKNATDDKAIELALIENIQRSDLNPIEEAYGYKRLMERRGMTQTEVAQAVSKGRSTIANALRLLELPEDAQQMLYEEKITAGHARAILSVQTPSGRKKLTEKLIQEKLSVREAETLARLYNGQAKAASGRATAAPVPDYFKRAAKTLRKQLDTNVRIKSVKGKNKVEIEFQDEDDLRRLFQILVGEDEGPASEPAQIVEEATGEILGD